MGPIEKAYNDMMYGKQIPLAVMCNICGKPVLGSTLVQQYIGGTKYYGHSECIDRVPVPPVPTETAEPKQDLINHPSHYNTGKVEVIDYIIDKLTKEQFEGYIIGNVLKYVSRYRHKGGFEDLKKANWYLTKLIETEERE